VQLNWIKNKEINESIKTPLECVVVIYYVCQMSLKQRGMSTVHIVTNYSGHVSDPICRQ